MVDKKRIHYVGQLQQPGGKSENVELFVTKRPNITNLEAAAGIKWVDARFEPGHVMRYGAVANSALGVQGTDSHAAFQLAVDSGHEVYVPEGYYSIEGTIVIKSGGSLQGGKRFVMTSNTRLERFGASVEPILHVVGYQNYIDGGGGVLAARNAGGYTKGLLLLGNDPTETDYTSATSLISEYGTLKNFKVIGKEANTAWDGSVGVYIESNGRFRGDFTSPDHFETYYSHIENINAMQWDYPFHISTDSNAMSFVGCTAFKYGHAAYSINGYGNSFTNCNSEQPSSQDSTERYAWFFGRKDDPFGPETGCDKDSATKTITGISAASAAVVTAVAHGLSNADKIKIEDVIDNGPDGDLETAVNEGHFQISNVTTDTFTIPLDTSGLTNTYSSAGVVVTDPYPILGARSNNVSGFTEIQYDASTKKVRLVGFTTPIGAYDVSPFANTYGENEINITSTAPGGIGKSGLTDEAALGNNTVSTSVNFTSRTAKTIDLHGFQFRELDDASGDSYGTNEYKVFSGRLANLSASTVYTVLTIDEVGADSAGLVLSLTFCGKEETGADVHGGQISWLCPVTSDTERTPIKFMDFQANENAEDVTWSVAESVGTTATKGKFELKLTTGTSVGDYFYTWKVEMVHSNLEGINLDWDSDVTIQNGT